MVRSLSLTLALLALGASSAQARSSEDMTYAYDQVWSTSIRLVAVDFRFPITQRDPDIGFFLFEYQDGGRSYNGSLELVRTEGPNATPQVRVTVQLPQLPSYVERHVLDRLMRKLTDEHGQAPPTRRPAPPPPPARDDDTPDEDAAPAEE